MSCGRRIGPVILTIVLVSLSSGLCLAATIELQVVDELDQPIANLNIGLQLIDAGNPFLYVTRGTTDAAGRVLLDGVAPGRYAARVRGARGRFVELDDHPSIRPPAVTVENDLDQIRSRVRFVRGVPVIFRVAVDGNELPGATVVLQDLDRTYSTAIPMRRTEREIRLVPGRWTAHVQPIPGYLLTSVEVNRTSLPGHTAEFDLTAGELAWYVTFNFVAPASIWGHVYFKGEPFGVSVVARLQEAGPWLPQAQERGGSSFNEVSAAPIPQRWNYEMVVPDGRWLVTAEGDGLLFAEPPQVEVDLRPGEDRRIDFTVEGETDDGPGLTFVRVLDPSGRKVGDAVVEVWPEDPTARADEPVAREKTRGWGQAMIRGLADETFLFAAGHTGFIENSTVSSPPDPDRRPRRVIVRLKPGATVHTVARDDETPVAGVEVTLARLDEFESVLSSAEVAAWIQRPSGTTDETGHLWIRGVYPGRYRLAGTLKKDSAYWYFVEFRDPDDRRWYRTLERVYAGDEIDEIEIRLAPAGSVRGRFHCTDGSALPEEADALVLPGEPTGSNSTETDWVADAVFRADGHVLEGRQRDRLTIGPLEFGAYRLLVRPQGHDRWTWALGTESPAEASVVSVVSGEPTDLGSIPVDCGPVIVIRPRPPEGIVLPDLVASAVYHPSAELSGTITVEEKSRPVGRARTLIEPDRFQFRDLREGEARLIAIVRNPFFLPNPEIRVHVEATLERGKTVEIAPPVAGVGGAIEITLPENLAGLVVAVRVARETTGDEPSKPRILEVLDEDVLIPSLPAGTYRVDLCLDPACVDTRTPWGSLEVRPGTFVSP